MLEIRKGWEQGLDLEMSAGAELTVRAPHSMLAADGGGTPALQIDIVHWALGSGQWAMGSGPALVTRTVSV